MKEINLSQNKKALVDDNDFEWLSQYSWWFDGYGYALRRFKEDGKLKSIRMHALILNTPKGMHSDHIDGNTLNNQRNNLRIVNHAQNQWNRKMSKHNTSGYRGIHWHVKNKKWVVRINKNKKNIAIGCFAKKIDAINAYKKAAQEYYGEFARI